MNKTALITGGSKRIGKEMALYLASKGWNIIIHYNTSRNQAEELRQFLKKKYTNQNFTIIQTDLSKSKDTEMLIKKAKESSGDFNLLINNASVFEKSYIQETTSELFNKHISTNLKAPFILIRDFVSQIKKGIIINMIDTRVASNRSDYAAYSLSKKGLFELTKMAALEFAPDVRINAIAPGAVLPPQEEDNTYLINLAKKIPMKKPVGIQPILNSIDFIIENKQLTGQIIFADGGESLGQNH